MTPAERAALRELCEKATPGPWTCDHHGLEEDHAHIYAPNGEPVALVEIGSDAEDGDFIAAARTALPQLLDELERVEVWGREMQLSATAVDVKNRQLRERAEAAVCCADNERRAGRAERALERAKAVLEAIGGQPELDDLLDEWDVKDVYCVLRAHASLARVTLRTLEADKGKG